jgi:GNAT superfamily N-acetyltransferase
VLDEPVARRARGDLEAAADVRVEVAARHEHELLRVRRRLERLARELAGDEPPPAPPLGIELAELTEERLDDAFPVYAEGMADMPDADPGPLSSERWRSSALAAAVVLLALDGERVVGYAQLDTLGEGVLEHQLTAVARTHRGRGIARALKQAEIAWAADRGYHRLVTDTNWANAAMRRLNESLGYRELPPRVWVRRTL